MAPADQGPVGHGVEGRGAKEGEGQGGQYILPVVHGVEGRGAPEGQGWGREGSISYLLSTV